MSNRLYAKERERSMIAPSIETPVPSDEEVRLRAERMRAEVMGEILARAGRAIKRVVATLIEDINTGRTIRELASLDDRTLAELGITRSEIPAFVARARGGAHASTPAPQPVENTKVAA